MAARPAADWRLSACLCVPEQRSARDGERAVRWVQQTSKAASCWLVMMMDSRRFRRGGPMPHDGPVR